MKRTRSDGACKLCSQTLLQKEIRKHLSVCKEYQQAKGATEVFLVMAEAHPYWVCFEAEATLTLEKIDQYLRNLWMECCGHLSAFTIDKQRYASDDELDADEKNMKAKLKDAIGEKAKFSYEYDFGTTTDLLLTCISKTTGNHGLRTIARNNPPDIKCDICKEPAEEVCQNCIYDNKGFFCKHCASKHRCDIDFTLPIVNSPRMGMCGFTGEECRLIDE